MDKLQPGTLQEARPVRGQTISMLAGRSFYPLTHSRFGPAHCHWWLCGFRVMDKNNQDVDVLVLDFITIIRVTFDQEEIEMHIY